MTVHQLGGEDVSVNTASRYLWLQRKQGVSVVVSPSRHWWCLWLCSGSKEVEEITCDIVLSGTTQDAQARGSCRNCGRLTVWGPTFWGLGVPAAYQQVRYSGSVKINGQVHTFSGSLLY
jgi:hypothetical protein